MKNIQISEKHIDQTKPFKKIGVLNGKKVVELFTKGGYALVVATDGKKLNILGASPHIALSRHIATLQEPDLVMDELSKSEDMSSAVFKPLIQCWHERTKQIAENWDNANKY